MIHQPKLMPAHKLPPRKTIEQELKDAGLLELAIDAGLEVTPPLKQCLDAIITQDADTIEAKKKAEILSQNKNINVLIIGETGTGKELFARVIHGNSPGRFIGINTAGIPDGLLESELFGSVTGAFTGAIARVGLIESAENGTLFLDEIGDMPMLLQAKLLRAIQEREFRAIGSSEIKHFNCRIVSATNRNVEELKTGRHGFRKDLYYRLAGSIITLKELKDRGDDWRLIIKRFHPELDMTEQHLFLEQHTWDGNIRELMNWIEEDKTFRRQI